MAIQAWIAQTIASIDLKNIRIESSHTTVRIIPTIKNDFNANLTLK